MALTNLNQSLLQAGEGGLQPDLHPNASVLQLTRRFAAEQPGLNFTAMVAIQPSTSVLIPIIMFSVGLIGNIVALGVYICSSTWHRATAFYGILRGFFITSIMGYITVYPIMIAVHVNGLHWIGGSRLCDFHGFCVLTFGMSLAYMTAFLGFERFLAACRPITYNRKVEPRKIPFVLVLLWIVSLFTGILPLVGFGRISLQYPSTWCFIDWRDGETVGRLFSSVLATIIVAVVLLVVVTIIAGTAGAIYRTIKKRHATTGGKDNERGRYSLTLTIDDNSRRIPRRFFAADRSLLWATFNYILLAMGFLVCYIPIVIRIISNVSGQSKNNFKDMAAMHWAEFYPAFCPWLYILCHEQIWIRLTCRKPAYRDVPYSRRSLRRRSSRGSRRSSGRGHDRIREAVNHTRGEAAVVTGSATSNHVNVIMHDHVDGYAVVSRQEADGREEESGRGRSVRKKLDFIKEDDSSNSRSPQSPSATNSPTSLPTKSNNRVRSPSSPSSSVSSSRSPTKDAPRSPSSSSTVSLPNSNRSVSSSSEPSLPKDKIRSASSSSSSVSSSRSPTKDTPRSPPRVSSPPSSVTDPLIPVTTPKTKLILTNSYPVTNGPVVIQNHVNANRTKSGATSTAGVVRRTKKGDYSRVPAGESAENSPVVSPTSDVAARRSTYAEAGRKESSI